MNKYHNGKIYKIVDVGYNKCYIGSTTESLSRRMSKHRYKYKKYKDGGDKHATCYDMFDEYGIEHCKIELIEYCKCETKDELLRREGQIIKDTDCVNRCVTGRTDREYYEDNYEKIQEKNKQWYKENTERFKEYRKKYYEQHKTDILQKEKERRVEKSEEMKKYMQNYYVKNIDKIKARSKAHRENNSEHYKQYWKQRTLNNQERITCTCGCKCLKSGIRRHERTKGHQEYIKSLEQVD